MKKLGFVSFGAPLLKAHSHMASLPAKLSKGGDFSHPLQPPSRVWLAQYESCLLRHTRRDAAGLSATEASALFKAKNVTWLKKRQFSIQM